MYSYFNFCLYYVRMIVEWNLSNLLYKSTIDTCIYISIKYIILPFLYVLFRFYVHIKTRNYVKVTSYAATNPSERKMNKFHEMVLFKSREKK